MDLDLTSYNIDELVNALALRPKNKYNVQELKVATERKLKAIASVPNSDIEDKDALFNFFVKACVRIATAYGLEIPQHILEEFNTVRGGLLPSMRDTVVFKQGNHFVEKHENDRPLSTYNVRFKEGVVNPLKRKTVRKILNINTRFRNNYSTTISTNFIFSLPYNIKNIVSLRLVSIEFPNTIYPFSSNLCSNCFTIFTYNTNFGGKTGIKVIIPNGFYTAEDLVLYLNSFFALTPSLNRVVCSYNINTGKFIFSQNPATPADEVFDLDFTCCPTDPCSITSHGEIDRKHITMGWMLGFRESVYIYEDDYNTTNSQYEEIGYNPEGTFDSHGTRYFLVSVNDYNKNHSSNMISPFKKDSLADNDILAKIPYHNEIFKNTQDKCCLHNERNYFGPVNLNRFEIKIFDEYGRIVDMNNMDYSLSFEIELMYDL